jgi:acetolactate synthase-1/2/3 large subunit
MLMAELETAVREGARLTAVVFDNAMYGTIRMHQEQAHPGRTVATGLGPIDFAAVAEACGAERGGSTTTPTWTAFGRRSIPTTSPVHVRTDPRGCPSIGSCPR